MQIAIAENISPEHEKLGHCVVVCRRVCRRGCQKIRALGGWVKARNIHRLYFNTAINDCSDLSKLLQYLANSSADNNNFGALLQAVKHHNVVNIQLCREYISTHFPEATGNNEDEVF